MNCSHVGHDCVVGNDVIFATSATLGGHCEIGDFVFMGGLSAVHQFGRVGSQVMIGAAHRRAQRRHPLRPCQRPDTRALTGLNVVGMKRRRFSRERLATVRSFYLRAVSRSRRVCRAPERGAASGGHRSRDRGNPVISSMPERHRELCQPLKGRQGDLILAVSIARKPEAPRTPEAMTNEALQISSPVGIVAAGGVMPFAVADSLIARGLDPVLFALKGACDPQAVARFRHHWISVGQIGRAMKLFRSENCRDLVFIGTLVRPALSEIRLDWTTLRVSAGCGRRSGAATITCCPASAAFSSGRFPHGRDQGCRAGSADAGGMRHPDRAR